jgi:hypothetical protein
MVFRLLTGPVDLYSCQCPIDALRNDGHLRPLAACACDLRRSSCVVLAGTHRQPAARNPRSAIRNRFPALAFALCSRFLIISFHGRTPNVQTFLPRSNGSARQNAGILREGGSRTSCPRGVLALCLSLLEVRNPQFTILLLILALCHLLFTLKSEIRNLKFSTAEEPMIRWSFVPSPSGDNWVCNNLCASSLFSSEISSLLAFFMLRSCDTQPCVPIDPAGQIRATDLETTFRM